jgi:DMSO reductase anchor subunit
MGGIAFLVALLAVTDLWYAGPPFFNAVMAARHGILNLPALVLGAVGIWVGGLFALAAGTLTREPPALPDRAATMGWTIVVFVAVLAIVVMRRPEVEERLPPEARRALDGRFILIGAVVATAVFFAAGYVPSLTGAH